MFSFLSRIMKMIGFVPVKMRERLLREIFLLEKENDKLLTEMSELKDENASLWDMLDEIKQSDIAQHTANQMDLESFLDKIKDEMTTQMLKDFKPVGDA